MRAVDSSKLLRHTTQMLPPVPRFLPFATLRLGLGQSAIMSTKHDRDCYRKSDISRNADLMSPTLVSSLMIQSGKWAKMRARVSRRLLVSPGPGCGVCLRAVQKSSMIEWLRHKEISSPERVVITTDAAEHHRQLLDTKCFASWLMAAVRHQLNKPGSVFGEILEAKGNVYVQRTALIIRTR